MNFKALFIVGFLLIQNIFALAQYEIGVSTDYPPYNYLNEKGELVGFNIDLLNAIQKLYGIRFNIKGENWKNVNLLLNEKKIQALAGVNYPGSPDYEYNYTRSVIRTTHCFLYNNNYLKSVSADEIRTEKSPIIVMWQNDVLVHYIASINPNARFRYVNSYEELLNELDKKEVTCAFSQKISSMYFAEKMNKPYIRAGTEEVLERNMGFKISKDSPQLSGILNDGLEVIMSNGQYREIYNKWINKYNNHDYNWANLMKYLILTGLIVLTIIAILLIFNYLLRVNVKIKTRDLQEQLALNKEITRELEKQKLKAEESDKMKSAFLANMSHEIRTPMNGIMGFTELLKSHDFSADEQKHFIDIIQQSGERMLNTINNIIEITKIESGLETIHFSETHPEKTIEELYHFFQFEANKKGIGLYIEQKKITANQAFFTDSNKVNSIITNLIKNALKFTIEGQVKIGYTLTNESFSFYVSDTGIGIEKAKQEAVFNHFVQADSTISSRFEGSGLGLSISKEYTKMLNGSIRLESEIDKGTTFYVEIPNHLQNGAKGSTADEVVKKRNTAIPAGLKIIVAEDDETSFFYLHYILKELSAHVLRAVTGLEAVELAQKNTDADIILMDSKMPELNGLEAVKRIREFNPDVFIIAQTAYAQEDYRDKTINAGCNEYIEKPVDKNKLITLISKGINNN